MDPRLETLDSVVRLNTRLFLNCLDGVDEEAARTRISGHTNHLAFLGAHLVGARAYLAGMLGQDATDPFQDLLGAVTHIDKAKGFPTVPQIRSAWTEVSERVRAGLADTSTETARAEADHGFPIDDRTLAGRVAFLIQHDSYHIGQMALLRKHLGLGALSYQERNEP